MANLFKIKEIARAKRISIKNLAENVGITEQGLQKLIRDNSTKVETLEKIAHELEVPIGYFFDDTLLGTQITQTGDKNQVGNGNIIMEHQNDTMAKEIEHLKKILEEKERTIQILMNK